MTPHDAIATEFDKQWPKTLVRMGGWRGTTIAQIVLFALEAHGFTVVRSEVAAKMLSAFPGDQQ